MDVPIETLLVALSKALLMGCWLLVSVIIGEGGEGGDRYKSMTNAIWLFDPESERSDIKTSIHTFM